MATKKPNSKTPEKEQKHGTLNIAIRIDRLVNYGDSKLKAIASANIGGFFAVHGIRIVDSQKGLFVQMPQTSYLKDGKTEYADIFHPITTEARNELYSKVMDAYNQKLDEAASQSENVDKCESEIENADESNSTDEQEKKNPVLEQSM